MINLLYKRQFRVNDRMSVVIPTLRDIFEFGEEEYYSQVSSMTAMPIDMMAALDDVGIDFTTISEYDLFLLLFGGIKTQDTHLLLTGVDLSKFELSANTQNGTLVLYDAENDIVIDRAVHDKIARILRNIHHIEKDIRKPANNEAKKYLLERAHKKAKRRKGRESQSQLEPMITAVVNTEQFKYNYDTVLDLTIYQFNESVLQIVKKIDYDNRMHGVYSGTVSAKSLSQDDLNWMKHK